MKRMTRTQGLRRRKVQEGHIDCSALGWLESGHYLMKPGECVEACKVSKIINDLGKVKDDSETFEGHLTSLSYLCCLPQP